MAMTMYLVSRYSDGQFLEKINNIMSFGFGNLGYLYHLPIMCLQQEILVVEDVVTLIMDNHQVG